MEGRKREGKGMEREKRDREERKGREGREVETGPLIG